MNRLAATSAVTILLALAPSTASAQKCEAAKLLALGKHYDCVVAAQAKAVKKTGKTVSPGQPACGDKLAPKWAKADAFGGCPTMVTAADAVLASTQLTDALSDTLAPGAPAPSMCSARKLRGASKYVLCRAKVHRKNVLAAKPLDFAKCDAKLTTAFAKGEALSAADCLTLSDLEPARAQATADTDTIVALLSGSTTTLSDTFDGVALDPSWTVLNGAVATLSVAGGRLHLQVDTQSNWFDTFESVLVHKDVTGDFDVRSTVFAAKTSSPLDPPDPEYRLGGILARDPASTPATSNFVHVALGSGPFATPFTAEDKTTVDSMSAYVFHPIAATEGELRLTRVGDDFAMYYRPIGDPTWQLLGSHTRADLPATLQVGLMAYDFNASPDLTVSFEEILFD